MKKLETKVVNLAIYIAEKLNDKGSIAHFLTMCQRYKESFLKKTLEDVLRIPSSKIRKSRGAYFTFLVKTHGAKNRCRS